MYNPLGELLQESGVNPKLASLSAFNRQPNDSFTQFMPKISYVGDPRQRISSQQHSTQPVGSNSSFNMSQNPQTGRVGGSRSWRNANPGNLKYGDFARKHGAIGKDPNGFAIFPNEQAGRGAMSSLLRGGIYGKLPVAQAIARYSPSSDNNNIPAYIKTTGVNPNATLGSLDDSTFNMLLDNMIKHEGWNPGGIS